jgi:hypothetical protein
MARVGPTFALVAFGYSELKPQGGRLMRLLFRLAILALAGYGAKALYDRYAPRAEMLRGPASEFVDRAKGAVGDSAQQMTSAAKDLTTEIKSAADDAATEVTGTAASG